MKKQKNPLFLLSFIPAIAYWYLESYHSLEIALIGGGALAIAEILIEKKISGHVHALSRLNLCLIIFLGGISYFAREGIFFKLQPTFTCLSLAFFLLYKKIKKESFLFEMLIEMNSSGKDLSQNALTEQQIKKMEGDFCLFLFLYAIFMAWIGFSSPTATWLFWKTAGFYLAFGLFLISELLYLRWYLIRKKR